MNIKDVQLRSNNIAKGVKLIDKSDLNKLRREIYAKGNKRDICVFEMLNNLGVRVSELISFELEDIKLTERNGTNTFSYIVVREGKGCKYREIPINSDVKNAIKEYLEVRPITKESKLLIGERGALQREAINRILRKYCISAGIESVNPHCLRSCLGTRLLKEKNVDIVTVSKILGHSSITTTERYYLGTNMSHMANALNSLVE